MPSLSGSILRFAWPGAILLVLAVTGLILFALSRHVSRRLRLRHLERLREQLEPLLRDLYAGAVGYEQGLTRLRALTVNLKRRALEEVLMAERNPPIGRVTILGRLCEDLGLVSTWWHELIATGAATRPLSFVRRADAVANLSIIRHRPSWPLLAAALSDPHDSVRSVAARALAEIAEPESFRHLAKRLRSAALERVPAISSVALKMALSSFPLAEASQLREFLEDPCRTVRSFAADVVAAMVGHEVAVCANQNRTTPRLDPVLVELLFMRLVSDEDPEVRVRVADVAGHVDDARSVPLLQALANDREWFVRLHAIRALGRQRHSPLNEISRHLTDRNWRVREATAQVLMARGQAGISRLLDHFSSTEDKYSKEQVAEQIAKAGLIPSLVENVGNPGRDSERRFIEGMVRIGMGDALLAALGNGTRRRCMNVLRRAFASSPDPVICAFAEQFLARDEHEGSPEELRMEESKLAARWRG